MYYYFVQIACCQEKGEWHFFSNQSVFTGDILLHKGLAQHSCHLLIFQSWI